MLPLNSITEFLTTLNETSRLQPIKCQPPPIFISGHLPITVPVRLTAALLLLPNSPAKQHRPISESLLSSPLLYECHCKLKQILQISCVSNRNRKFEKNKISENLNLQWEEIRDEAHKQQQLASLE
uniref:Uncharacterized protein n=1 Tax=Cucumis sativus TaxID=3659 RepID=A0A0A0LCJ3_CUCSA